jgi:hypothetical protein
MTDDADDQDDKYNDYEEELDALLSALHRRMYRAIEHRRDEDVRDNYDGNYDDYDGLDDDALEPFIEDLSDDLSEGHCPTSDAIGEREVLLAAQKHYEKLNGGAYGWDYESVTRAISKLTE